MKQPTPYKHIYWDKILGCVKNAPMFRIVPNVILQQTHFVVPHSATIRSKSSLHLGVLET